MARAGRRSTGYLCVPTGDLVGGGVLELAEGAGEAGAIPVGPLFAQALEDALYDMDFEILEIPLNSNRLWELVKEK